MGLLVLAAAAAWASGTPAYPPAPRAHVVDDYFGVKVPDPYRPLEDLDASATRAWVQAENRLTFNWLGQVSERAAIRRRLAALWNYERFGIPFQEGGRYFYYHNDGLQNQSVLYTVKPLEGKPRVLLDPNRLAKDGTVALTDLAVSRDGRRLAYGLSTAGSDWQEWHVRDVASGRDLPDVIRWVKFTSTSWTRDGRGFFYNRYAAPPPGTKMKAANYFQKLYYHRIGTPQSADVLVYDDPRRKDWMFDGSVTDDGHYLVVSVSKANEKNNLIWYKRLAASEANVGKAAPMVHLIPDFAAQTGLVGSEGERFWLQTNLDAPRGRVVAVDLRHPRESRWRTVIPEAKDALQSVSLVGNRFIATYLHDAHARVEVFDLAGRPVRSVRLPGIGSVDGFYGHRADRQTFYRYTSYTTPAAIYRYDVATGRSTLFRRPKVDFNPADFETREIFYHSKDGTRVPMFITARKGLRLDGSHPTILYGYGGFDIPIEPGFSVTRLEWMEMGGVWCVANIRGGSEYGEKWHEAGMKARKQNVFDDFIAAAQWLVAHRYTSRKKLAIFGQSNGGLLVGACLTQRPDLFGAAVAGVGVLDMLRFQKFTIGWAWVTEYGSSDNPTDFKTLYAYSPLQNVKPGTVYPPTLILTGDHDDRVFPAHSFKFAAALQAAQAGPAPILLRVETRAGHGGGKPTDKLIDEYADIFSFLVRALDMHPRR